jgi:hypothetical protein
MRASVGGFSKVLVLAVMLTVGFGTSAFADGDDSAIARGGFAAAVHASKGVVLRVEINANGEEKRDSATMRLHVGDAPVAAAADVQTAFARGVDASSQPQLNPEDINRDSSTGWCRYRHHGWAAPYYYATYTPVYYNVGYAYTFQTAAWYTVWSYPVSYRYYYWTW